MLKTILDRIYKDDIPSIDDIKYLLKIEDETEMKTLFEYSNNVRKEFMGDGIFLRALIEFSNKCYQSCSYCGLNINNQKLERYELTKNEIMDMVQFAHRDKLGTVVLQAGDNTLLDIDWMADIVKTIRQTYPELAITLSFGEKTYEEYKLLKDSGADRYLLKMESYNKNLYESLHPKMSYENRLKCLSYLRDLKFQVGSGNIIGLKGQTFDDIALDIINFKKGEYEMISVSPFIPHPETDLKDEKMASVPMVLKVLAVTRIIVKLANMPATTALGSMGKDYRFDALKAGANIVMPNYTPTINRKLYEIYPNKRCLNEAVGLCSKCLAGMAHSLGRHIGVGRGDIIRH